LKRLFGIQGLWIGVLGSFWGLVLGAVLGALLKAGKVLKVAKEVYLIEELPIRFSLGVLFTVCLAGLLITFLATQVGIYRLKRAPLDL
jgi:ABC-type lipoprotein release transport system permease subunit